MEKPVIENDSQGELARRGPASSEHEHKQRFVEFQAMRAEIDSRSKAQHTLISLNVTAAGALGGFALAKDGNTDLLLILAVLSPSLGLLWTDHAITIERIGNYIRENLRFGWEERVQQSRRVFVERSFFGGQILLLFAGPAVTGLAITYHRLNLAWSKTHSWIDGLWVAGLSYAAIFAVRTLWYIVEPCYGEPIRRIVKRVLNAVRRRLPRHRRGDPQLATEAWQFGFEHLKQLRTRYGVAASDAGTGFYHTLFGRDSLWCLIFVLEAQQLRSDAEFSEWVQALGVDVLSALAETQGSKDDPESEEQPGKIIHEYRDEEALRDPRLVDLDLGFVNGCLYSGMDQTFLYICAFRAFTDAYPGNAIARALWGSVERAVLWVEKYADEDRDGLYEYRRRNTKNLLNQVWKDSFDSAVTGGADVPAQPLAWLEVQGYGYRALCDAAHLYARFAPEQTTRPGELRSRAESLRELVNRSFWTEDLRCYSMAISGVGSNGMNRPVGVVSSNVGHAMWSGILFSEGEQNATARLSQPDILTPFGIRTVASSAPMYAPFAYHRGSIWPFDNAVLAIALDRIGQRTLALEVARRVWNAVKTIGSPIELYIALDRDLFVTPTIETPAALLLRRAGQANRNQAWTAAAIMYFAALLSHASGPRQS